MIGMSSAGALLTYFPGNRNCCGPPYCEDRLIPLGCGARCQNSRQPTEVQQLALEEGYEHKVEAMSDDPVDTPELGDTLVADPETRSTDDGDHERFAHYVPKDKIVESAVTGEPVRALCGKVWTPGRDPGKYPVCPDCQRIYEGLPPGGDDES